jgi:hypothetical protein
VVPDKASRVALFHQNTLRALASLIAAAGLCTLSGLKLSHIVRRVSPNKVMLASALLPYLEPEQLLEPIEEPGPDVDPISGEALPLSEVFATY